MIISTKKAVCEMILAGKRRKTDRGTSLNSVSNRIYFPPFPLPLTPLVFHQTNPKNIYTREVHGRSESTREFKRQMSSIEHFGQPEQNQEASGLKPSQREQKLRTMNRLGANFDKYHLSNTVFVANILVK